MSKCINIKIIVNASFSVLKTVFSKLSKLYKKAKFFSINLINLIKKKAILE